MRIQSAQNYNSNTKVNFGMFLQRANGISEKATLELTKAAAEIEPRKLFTIEVIKALGGLPGKIIVATDNQIYKATRNGEYSLELALEAVKELAGKLNKIFEKTFTIPIKKPWPIENGANK